MSVMPTKRKRKARHSLKGREIASVKATMTMKRKVSIMCCWESLIGHCRHEVILVEVLGISACQLRRRYLIAPERSENTGPVGLFFSGHSKPPLGRLDDIDAT